MVSSSLLPTRRPAGTSASTLRRRAIAERESAESLAHGAGEGITLIKRRDWFGSISDASQYANATSLIKGGALIDFKVFDASGARHGLCIGEIIGQKIF